MTLKNEKYVRFNSLTKVISMTFVDTGDSDRKNDGKRRNRQKEIFEEIGGDPIANKAIYTTHG